MAGGILNSSPGEIVPSPILPPGRSVGGILERVQPVGGGLVQISFESGTSYSVDESLFDQLSGMIGQQTAIFRFNGHWGAGGMA